MIREGIRAVRGWRWFEALAQDLAYGFRTLQRSPGFTAVAVITLALGIGASTAIFSGAYGVLLRPLPYRDAGSIVLIQSRDRVTGQLTFAGFSGPDLDDWSAHTRSFHSLALSGLTSFAVDADSGYEMLRGATVSDHFFATFRESLLFGRAPNRGELEAVISYRLSKQQFQDAQAAVGQQIRLNGESHTVVGVARADFDLPRDMRRVSLSQEPDAWVPFGRQPTDDDRRMRFYHLVGRLKTGVTLDQAQADADALAAAVSDEFSDGRNDPVVIPLHEYLTGTVRGPLRLFFVAVSLVLLIACANVTGLLLTRQASRSRELIVRKALGAPRSRLLLQSVVESTWLSAGGAVGGVILAVWAISVLRWLGPTELPRLGAIRVDLLAIVFALAVSTCAAMFVGLIAGVPLMRRHVTRWGWVAAPFGADTRPARRLRSVMVAAQLALSAVLLVGAMLVGKSFIQLLNVDLGVVQDRVLSVQLNLSMGRDPDATARIDLTEQVIERVLALPGVEAVGAANGLPPNQTRLGFQFEDEAATFGPPKVHRFTLLNPTPGYFGALNIQLLHGRLFSEQDTAVSAPVLVLGASAARRLFGTVDVVGRSLPTVQDQKPMIVGVVNDVRYSGLDSPAPETVYQPFAQYPFRHMNLVVRTSSDPLELAGAVRSAIHEVDRGITIASTNSLDALVSDSLSTPRLRAALLLTLAVLSLALASLGLGGAVAYSVGQRTPEIAIRMALGARVAHVLALVLQESCGLALVGLTVGLLSAWVVVRSLESFLYNVAPTDGQSFLMTGLCLGVVTLVASYFPARRAAATDPATALRAE